MKNINAAQVKSLRDSTGARYMVCKDALTQAEGDMKKATLILRQRGVAVAKKKIHRTTAEGIIGSYIHFDSQIGVMVEVNCETDFAAATDIFKDFVNDLAKHITAMAPTYVKSSDVPENIVESEKAVYTKQLQLEGKSEKIIDNIVSGKLNKFYKTNCLLDQQYYKDSEQTIKDVLDFTIGRLGENITISRFVMFSVGDK